MLSEQVAKFWGEHTVDDRMPESKGQAIQFLEERWSTYRRKNFLTVRPSEYILDFGCGPGHDILENFLTGNAKRQEGVDVSEKALQRAQRRVELFGIDCRLTHLSETSDLPFPCNTFDGIFCNGVLHHCSKPFFILREFARVLKPGGWLKLMVHNPNSIFYHVCCGWQMKGCSNWGRTTWGEWMHYAEGGGGCPIADLWEPSFVQFMAERCKLEYVYWYGGYINAQEEINVPDVRKQMNESGRVEPADLEFVNKLSDDLTLDGKDAGLYNVYDLRKPPCGF